MASGHSVSGWLRTLGRAKPSRGAADPLAAQPRRAEAPQLEAQDTEPGDWAASSVDLLRGTDVTEYPDTVTDALLEELFRPQAMAPAGTAP